MYSSLWVRRSEKRGRDTGILLVPGDSTNWGKAHRHVEGRSGRGMDNFIYVPALPSTALNNLLKLPSASISSAENKNKSRNIIVSAP